VDSARLIVGSYIVKFAKLASKLEVCLVNQVCSTDDGKAILNSVLVQGSYVGASTRSALPSSLQSRENDMLDQ
jgi:hypothetical protein